MMRVKRKLASVAIAIGWNAVTMFGASRPLGSRADGAAELAPVAAVATASVASGRLGATAEVERYANRERSTPALSEFRGGDTIALGTSAMALIMAIVLVLVLI